MRHGLHAENEELNEGEVRKVIRKLKGGKAAGVCGIDAR